MGTDQQPGCSSIHKLGLEATGCFSHLTAYLSCCVDSCFKVHGTALNWIFCFTISFSSGGQGWRWRARVAAAVAGYNHRARAGDCSRLGWLLWSRWRTEEERRMLNQEETPRGASIRATCHAERFIMCELTMRLLLAWLPLGPAAVRRSGGRGGGGGGPGRGVATPPRPAPPLHSAPATRAEGNWFGKVWCLAAVAPGLGWWLLN